MSYTKGPWIYDIHEGSFYIFTKPELDMVADGDPDDVGIARIRGVGRGADSEEQEANAAIIAAAPELLEACRLAFDYISTQDYPGDEAMGEIREAVREAIAKAVLP